MTRAIIVRFPLYPPGRAERMVSHPITAAHCRGKSKTRAMNPGIQGAHTYTHAHTHAREGASKQLYQH